MSLTFPPDDNGDVLRKLQRGGDDLSLPRDINFSVVFATEANAIAFAKLFESPDTRVEVERAEAMPGLSWDVTVIRHMVPDHGAIGGLVGRADFITGRNVDGGHDLLRLGWIE